MESKPQQRMVILAGARRKLFAANLYGYLKWEATIIIVIWNNLFMLSFSSIIKNKHCSSEALNCRLKSKIQNPSFQQSTASSGMMIIMVQICF